MIIVNYRAGQLANRLFHFSHFIANSKSFSYKLIYPFFQEYLEFFELDDADFQSGRIKLNYTSVRFLNRKLQKLINSLDKKQRTGKLFGGLLEFHEIGENDIEDLSFDMRAPDFAAKANHKVLITKGWMYRDQESLDYYADRIRAIFTPRETYRELVQSEIEQLRKKDEIIIGVHIRRGDYKEFENGKWFYGDDVYSRNMKRIEEICRGKGKSCTFFIASNEEVCLQNFDGLNVYWKERHFITDLYCLANCDYLIGPPSTYSMWAAFYGKIPLFQIEKEDSIIHEADFSIPTISF